MKKKILLWLLLFSWMCVIFLFSSQDADASSRLSSGILHRFVLTLLPETAAADQELVHTLEFLLRKAAHMTEYAILAILAFAQLRQYIPANFRKANQQHRDMQAKKDPASLLQRPFFQLLLVCCFVFLYACTDEFHQRFSSGRSGNLKDVLIDTTGGLLGGLFFLLCSYIHQSLVIKREAKAHSASQR